MTVELLGNLLPLALNLTLMAEDQAPRGTCHPHLDNTIGTLLLMIKSGIRNRASAEIWQEGHIYK